MLPELNRIYKNTTQIDVFRGLNRTVNTGFSRVSSNSSAIYTEFSDMKNLCGDKFPQLSTRRKRSRINRGSAVIVSNIIVVNGKLMWVEMEEGEVYGKLCFDGEKKLIHGFSSGTLTLTQYGNQVIMMPVKKWFNLSDKTINEIEVSGTIDFSQHSANTNTVDKPDADEHRYMTSCSIEKMSYDIYDKLRPAGFKVVSGFDLTDERFQRQVSEAHDFPWDDVFTAIKEGDLVETMVGSPGWLYRCVGVTANQGCNTDNKQRVMIRVSDYYVGIHVKSKSHMSGALNLIKSFKPGDFVKISGMGHMMGTNSNNLKSEGEQEGAQDMLLEDLNFTGYLTTLNNNTFKVFDVVVNDDSNEAWLVIKADINSSVPYTGTMKLERVMPPGMDDELLIEVNNRLWGCSSSANEIYSSKQGDCTNWQAYGDGISTDSFAATIGCEGDFTAIARQNDSVIFFKENWIIKLYGNKPSNYTTAVFNVPGVEKGSGKSVVWVNGVLYYLSPCGVCRYSTGGQPVVISENAFGDKHYTDGVGGRHKDKYVLSAKNEDGFYEMFVFDTNTGLWHKEDNTQMTGCVTYNNVLYYVDMETGCLTCMEAQHNFLEKNTAFELEGDFDWMCETGNLYDSDFNAKHISKIQVLADLGESARFEVLAQFRDRGEWRKLREVRRETVRPRRIDVAMRRSDYLRLRFKGEGSCRIAGILIEYGRGSGIK